MADGRKQARQPDLPAAPRGAGAGRPHLAGQREGGPRAHQAAGAGASEVASTRPPAEPPAGGRAPRDRRDASSPSTGKRAPPKPSRPAISWPATSPRWAIASPVQQFRFHPSTLLGLPILGAGVGAAALLALPLLALPGVPGWGALVVWGLVLAATACLAGGVAAGWLTLGEAREDANLVAVRGDGAAPPVDRGAPGHQGPGAVHGGPAGRGMGAARRRRLRRRSGARSAGRAASAVDGRLRMRHSPWWRVPSPAAAGCAGRRAGRGTTEAAWWPRWRAPRRRTTRATGILITGAEEFGLVGARMFARIQGRLDGRDGRQPRHDRRRGSALRRET